jgi:prepilin signal peptidase PulO-like enzyme (type II secretory pathway)
MAEPRRLQRLQIGLAAAALLLTALVGLFFITQVLVANEACYGVRAFKNPCEPASPQSVGRLLLVIAIVLALFAAGWLAARGQQRAAEPSARTAALMFLVTYTVIVLGITLSSLEGAGLYFLPSALLLLAAAITGVVLQLRGATSESAPAPGETPHP